MPYFERLPYTEMIARAADGSSAVASVPSSVKPPPNVNPPHIKPPIMEQAAAILKEESAGLPSSSTSCLKLPFLDTDTDHVKGVAGNVLLLNPPPPVKAGQTGTVVLSIVNESEASLSFSMMTTHLISQSGARIAANNIDISPEEAVIAPAEAVDVQVTVNVPEIIIPGEYSGLLQAYGKQTVHAVLVINVTN